MGFWTNDRLEPKRCGKIISSRASAKRRCSFGMAQTLSPYTQRPEAGKCPGSLLGSRAHRPKARQPLGGFSCGRPLGSGAFCFTGILFFRHSLQWGAWIETWVLDCRHRFLPPFLPGPVQVRAAAPYPVPRNRDHAGAWRTEDSWHFLLWPAAGSCGRLHLRARLAGGPGRLQSLCACIFAIDT